MQVTYPSSAEILIMIWFAISALGINSIITYSGTTQKTQRLAPSTADLRQPSGEVTVHFAPVENADKGDGIAVNNQAEPVIAGSNAKIGTFCFQFFQVVDRGYAAGGFDFQNDFLYAVQEILVVGMSLQILGKAFGKRGFHPLPSRMSNTSFRLAAPVFSPS